MDAFVAQSVERSLGKTEVSGSIPDEGSEVGSAAKYCKNSLSQVTQVATRAVCKTAGISLPRFESWTWHKQTVQTKSPVMGDFFVNLIYLSKFSKIESSRQGGTAHLKNGYCLINIL